MTRAMRDGATTRRDASEGRLSAMSVRPHKFVRNSWDVHFLICECGKHEAHSIHHQKEASQ